MEGLKKRELEAWNEVKEGFQDKDSLIEVAKKAIRPASSVELIGQEGVKVNRN